ncbi:hypothetical protein B0T20DRAFT_414688 [Sordaria brevicollis]|uniref:Uncharacterized protein n=1 Tax=Sordaria brevicollis TaxID=83679 RepID=A0AAE0UAD3_SORBR|nr:hypothetical protein B0T20DRAFT_414688 [Sordaria brevicollis]
MHLHVITQVLVTQQALGIFILFSFDFHSPRISTYLWWATAIFKCHRPLSVSRRVIVACTPNPVCQSWHAVCNRVAVECNKRFTYRNAPVTTSKVQSRPSCRSKSRPWLLVYRSLPLSSDKKDALFFFPSSRCRCRCRLLVLLVAICWVRMAFELLYENRGRRKLCTVLLCCLSTSFSFASFLLTLVLF